MILVVALALRVGTAVAIQRQLDGLPGRTFLIEGDANGYWHLAEEIAAGRDYAIYDPPRRVMRMPGFPALLAVPISLFQSPMMPARLMLAVLGTLACGLVWCLGRALSGTRVANLAAGLTAVSPVMIGFSPVVLSETAFAVSLLASLLGMSWWARFDRHEERQIDNSTYTKAAVIGLVVGGLIALACYLRPSWLLAGPLFGAAAVATSANKGRALLMAFCVMVGLLGLLLPWGLRNQRVAGHFTFTTFWLGPSLYDGLNPQATGASDMAFYDRDQLMAQGMSEYEVDRHYRGAAGRFVRDNPGRSVELAAIKLGRFLKPWPNAEQFDTWKLALLTGCFFTGISIFALRGWWMTRHSAWIGALTLGPLFYFAALHMVFVGSLRYRLPAEYPLTILAAIGWTTWRSPSVTNKSRQTSQV